LEDHPRWQTILPWLTPALAAALVGAAFWLAAGPINRVLAWFFRGFNRGFARTTDLYTALGRHAPAR